ncbi:cyclohexanecarboxylate-CoA ligase [Rhodovulum sp. 12E13]|uniref:class I adenylate-forming enzyme family protein n=1 Tax=Rhodovulum sp. 12E13 TaxID=2203891 RepID=UPI000E139FF8|nr:class I adenylate-forming enzyme family protein [Rhodovulum sp. 12E13]RDC71963.1 cyclohexanecarboxylate-CoA ligase [Rhodovulum sp. 12E13]
MALTQPHFSRQNLLTRLTPGMAAHYRAQGFWGDETIYDRARAVAEARPEQVAIRDRGVALTYRDLVDLADRMAARFASEGYKPGERVAAWISSRCEIAVLLLACARCSLVFCPSLHRNHTAEEIARLLDRMDARLLVFERGYGADAERRNIDAVLTEQGARVRTQGLDPVAPRDAEGIARALDLPADPAPTCDAARADDVVYIAFTSGTTGEPKGVLHSNNTLLANARAMAGDWGFSDTSVIYTFGPLSHNLGFGALILTLLVGGELVLHDGARGISLIDRLHEAGATFIFGVPAHAMDLLAEFDRRPEAKLDHVRGFRISGAAVPTWLADKMQGYGIVPQSGYGMTEGCSHHYTLPDDPPERIASTSGRACPGYEAMIFDIDDPDRPLPAGDVGHIGGRGTSLMLGYFDDQRATERAFNRNGWFMTGDLGRIDADGYITITGRLKEIIIRGGHNIHPARIEQLAMKFPRVERAAALGVADERLGEKVCLVLMSKDGGEITAGEILPHLDRAGLSRFDMPEYLLNVPEIPLSPSGKILKRALVPDIASGQLRPDPVRFGETDA